MAHSSGRQDPAVGTTRQHRSPPPSTILEELLETPKEFSFTQAIRVLKQAFGPKGSQGKDIFLKQQLRVRPYLSLGFPPMIWSTSKRSPGRAKTNRMPCAASG